MGKDFTGAVDGALVLLIFIAVIISFLSLSYCIILDSAVSHILSFSKSYWLYV